MKNIRRMQINDKPYHKKELVRFLLVLPKDLKDELVNEALREGKSTTEYIKEILYARKK